MAATNKCLARSNKSRTGVKATKERRSAERAMKRVLFAAVAAFMLTSSVDAAEISCLDPLCQGYLLRGEIAKGDYEKVVKSLIYPWTYMFKLVSPGGDVDEALKIGRLFRKYLI